MKPYKLLLHAAAERQMDKIQAYILRNLKNPQAARNFLDAIRDALDSLRTMPERIPLVHFEPWRSRGFRCMTVRNYLIYFWIDEAARQVNVVAVIYGKRDQVAQMEAMKGN